MLIVFSCCDRGGRNIYDTAKPWSYLVTKSCPALILKNKVHKQNITLLACRLLIAKYPAYAQKRGAKLETGKDNIALKLRKPDIITRSENITTEHKSWDLKK